MRRVWMLPGLLLFTACQEGPLFPAAEGPRLSAATSEAPTFHWLPPVGTAPSAAGEFNPDVSALVTVCRIAPTASPAGTCIEVVATFYRDADSPLQLLTVDTQQEFYEAIWNTPAPNTALADAVYRITVYPTFTPDGAELGHVLLRMGPGGSILRSDGSAIPGVQAGDALPVRFRVDRSCTDCVETWIGEEEAVLTLPGQAQLYFPPDPNRAEFRVALTRYAGPGPCLPVPHPQYEACIEYTTTDLPAGYTFEQELTVFQCLDPAAVDIEDELGLWKWDAESDTTVQKLELSDVTAQSFGCSEFTASSAASGLAMRTLAVASRLVKPVARLLVPDVAYANSTLQGYKVRDLSRIGWVRELAIEKVAGDEQVAAAGSLLPVSPTVRVTSRLTGAPVAAVPVIFVPEDQVTVLTDAAGEASIPWTLGPTPGELYTLPVFALNPLATWVNMPGTAEFPTSQWAPFPGVGSADSVLMRITAPTVTFTATAASAEFVASFLPPLGRANQGRTAAVNPAPHVTICSVPCGAATSLHHSIEAVLRGNAYHANWHTPATLQAGRYRVRVVWQGAVLGEVTIHGVARGKKTPRDEFTFEIGSTLPVRFTLE
jgi:hypothetical protein